MPFKDSCIDAFFMINVFHHIKNPNKFLNEISRCLKPGGKIVMIEPAKTFFSSFIYQHFHHEDFNPEAGWHVTGEGPLSNANGALPWIVFCRDRSRFYREAQSLSIKTMRYHTPIRYLVSGGVSMRPLIPICFYPLIKAIEFLLSPFNRWIAMFFTIEIVKKEGT